MHEELLRLDSCCRALYLHLSCTAPLALVATDAAAMFTASNHMVSDARVAISVMVETEHNPLDPMHHLAKVELDSPDAPEPSCRSILFSVFRNLRAQ